MISCVRSMGTIAKYGFIQPLKRPSDAIKIFQSGRFIPQFLNETRFSNSRRFSKDAHDPKMLGFKEIEIPIPGGIVSAKAWGSDSGYPVLAFHGWQDNCGTFDKLIPLLSDQFYYVAIDAPGHGRSPYKPLGCVYTDISMIMDFKRVADALGWKKFHVLGHSLGAVLGLLFASAFPDLVQKLTLLDAVKPFSATEDIVPSIKAAGIHEHLKCENKMSNPAPVYSAETAAKRLMKGMHNEVNKEGIEVLLKRGARTSDCGTGLVFTRDLRMRPLEVISVRSHDTTESFMSGLKCELLIILANNTHPNYQMDSPEVVERFLNFYKKNIKHFALSRVEGNHFVHLNNAERVAPIVNDFMLTDNSRS